MVVLSSNGAGEGGLAAAMTMARSIKASGAATIVNTTIVNTGNTCGSACTLLFAAGAQTYHIGGDRIAEGVRAKGQPGLGFHQSRSPRGTAQMASAYAALTASAGADLAGRSPFETFYYISGQTSLSSGVATSLKRP